MNDKYEILAQNCLALAIDRCDKIGLPLKVKRQRMVIKGAIRQMLEDERLVERLEASEALVELVDNLTSGNIFDEEGVCTYCGAPTGYGDATHYVDCVYLELRIAISYWKEAINGQN